MKQVQGNEALFEVLIGKKIKLIMQDLDGPHFVRGILRKVTHDFLYVQGDYSEQIVPMSSVLKVNSLRGDQRGQDQDIFENA